MSSKNPLILANFGGPRDQEEVYPFLKALLCDQEVIRTPFPSWLHTLLFSKVAKKRALKVKNEYASLGGGSPIFRDTEALAMRLEERLHRPVIPFHRYLKKTHASFLQKIRLLEENEFTVFPLYPQFSYSTSGSVALFLKKQLPGKRFSWIRSYEDHPSFTQLFAKRIKHYLELHALKEETLLLLFSAHGLPKRYIDEGDPYQEECQRGFKSIASYFPKALSVLAYQSKVGKSEWLTPSTESVCLEIEAYQKKHVLVIPLSFTSDHIETLFEVEKGYLPLIRKKGISAHRLESFNVKEDWIEVIEVLLKSSLLVENNALLRK